MPILQTNNILDNDFLSSLDSEDTLIILTTDNGRNAIKRATIFTLENNLRINAQEIALKASKSVTDDIEQRVANAEASIIQTASSITLLALEMDILIQGLEQKVIENETLITDNANEIALKASKSELDDIEQRVANLEQKVIENEV
jgi:hypothetical protein